MTCPLAVLFSVVALPLVGGVFGPAVSVEECPRQAMAVEREGNRLYVAAGTELQVYDISAPLSPKLLGSVVGMDNRRQVAVKDAMAYVVSRETGLRVVDCTDPRQPRIRSRFDSVEFATGVEVVGNVAFLSERIYGVEFVDVSNPDRPAHIAIRKTCESQSSRYRNGYLYSGEWGAGKVTVFDVHDLMDIREVNSVDLKGFGDGLEIAGDYLYCSTGHDARQRPEFQGEAAVGRGRGMEIFSLADPAAPKFVSRIDFPRFKPRNEDFWTVRVACGLAFCADSHNGLFAVDVKDPARPALVDRFCVPQAGKPDWPSGAISSLAIGEGCVYVTCSPGGLFVLPVNGLMPEARAKGAAPLHPEFREPYPTAAGEFHVYKPSAPGQARTAVVRGDVVYAAFGDAGLEVLKIRPDGGFEKLGELPGGRRVLDCCLVGDRLVTAEGLDGFAVYALDGPAAFREKQRRGRLSDLSTVAFWCWAPTEKTVVLTGRNGGKQFFPIDDISRDRPLLEVFGGCQWDRYAGDRALGGVYPNLHAYKAMMWLDVNGDDVRKLPADPSFAAGQTCGVCAFDDRTFLATFSTHHAVAGGTLRAGSFFAFAERERRQFDYVPIPEIPELGTLGKSFSGVPRTDGRLVALNNRSAHAVALFDLADRRQPKLVKAWRLAGNPDLCAFHCGRLIIPAGHQGLLLQRSPELSRTELSHKPL